MAVQRGAGLVIDEGDLKRRVEALLVENGLTEAQLCDKLNRLKLRSSDGELLTIHVQIIDNLRAGGTISPVRLAHLAACLDGVFGKLDTPNQSGLIARSREAVRQISCLWLTAAALALFTVLAVVIFWLSDKANQERFVDLAQVLAVPMTLCALLISWITSNRK